MKLDEIRNQIPTMTCKPGCHDCCGTVPFSDEEWRRVRDQRKFVALTCPYTGEGGCDIYEERPLMCRLFGVVDSPIMRCPHGRSSQVLLTDAKARELLHAVYKNAPIMEMIRL